MTPLFLFAVFLLNRHSVKHLPVTSNHVPDTEAWNLFSAPVATVATKNKKRNIPPLARPFKTPQDFLLLSVC
jgi:hypothetical protein